MLLASQGIRKDVSETDFSQLNFEQALIALEEVVQQLESGSVPLDQSISLYERGEKLRKLCQARLDDAQARIEKIVTDGDGAASSTIPFDTDG
ncbi:MAG: exodeoxyribonuclease VII small subunit [Altererythrobacter sp.]|nr:exodeoxyribonuclease VII small subunit [Altererythrobacter sp.]NNE48690.1 exodeoxyribonuclease VII small subunit [Altererythrobacter sp.]NNF94711.1 exodeoxyribonuclease VII small subunit [Altererythrobacter sp.]NNK45247.1 exodeoxyribonuclease VII small subunit [Altererythrobacter sp.]